MVWCLGTLAAPSEDLSLVPSTLIRWLQPPIPLSLDDSISLLVFVDTVLTCTYSHMHIIKLRILCNGPTLGSTHRQSMAAHHLSTRLFFVPHVF